jgi:hypothetical protein
LGFVSFEGFGSLYFPSDVGGLALPTLKYVGHEGKKVSDPRSVVKPSTGREMFDDGRGTIEFDRGPCKFRALICSKLVWSSLGRSLEDYHAAIGEREIASVQNISRLPPSPVTLRAPGLYEPSHEKKVNALEA